MVLGQSWARSRLQRSQLTVDSLSLDSGLLALLDEEPQLQAYALQQLNSSGLVESHWAEIADEIVKL